MSLLVLASTARELACAAPGIAERDLAELRPVSGRIGRRKAVFCVTGVGPLNAALAAGLCLGRAGEAIGRIEAVLNLGLAGAFDLAATPLCSLWLVRREIWPEYGLNDGKSVTARAFRFPQWERPDGAMIYDELAVSGAELFGFAADDPPFAECSSLTVAGITASFDRASQLWNRYHAELENMEGFAVALAAARAGLPCVEVRSVSNKAGPRKGDEKDFDGALAALGRILPTLNLL